MKKDGEPEVIKVSDDDLSRVRVEISQSNLSENTKKIILGILDAYYWLFRMYQAKKLSLKKLRRLFGFKTEKSKSVDDKKIEDNDKDDSNLPPSSSGNNKNSSKGHGKNGKDKFKGAKKVFHALEDLGKGDQCPSCLMGKLYPVKPGVHIQFTGEAPVQAIIHETEKLRCNACGAYFEADLPEKFKQKYHPSCDVTLAVQKYALGIPFYRTGDWQKNMEVPLPPSTQWERCEALVNSLYPAYQSLLKFAREGDLIYADDTKNKILDLQQELRVSESKRVGVYTTGVISRAGERVINLFFTSMNYCGENLDKLLHGRIKQDKIILMSDALKMNLPKEAAVIWANCLVHARRNFWDIRESYGKMTAWVIEQFAKIYRNEARIIELKLDPEQRLQYHQKHSAPVLKNLRRWGLKKLFLKKIEPNEELGDALRYFFTHYKELTLFLRIAGVPLDNSIAERLLKAPIRNRKNSYFFKTLFGALVGDVVMSLIETAKSAKKNPYKYLLVLHENADWVKVNPNEWLPWNYEANLTV